MTQVEPDSAADKAGLQAGDVVVAVDDQLVSSSSALRNLIGLMEVGEKVHLSIIRDGKEKTLKSQIGKAPTAMLDGGRSLPKLAGAQFRNLDSS